MAEDLLIRVETFEEFPRTAVLFISGSIDTKTVISFQEKLKKVHKEGNHNFVLELSELHYINSTGVSTLVNVSDSLEKVSGKILIVNPHPKAKMVFDVLGLNAFFQTFSTIPEAFKAISKPAKKLDVLKASSPKLPAVQVKGKGKGTPKTAPQGKTSPATKSSIPSKSDKPKENKWAHLNKKAEKSLPDELTGGANTIQLDRDTLSNSVSGTKKLATIEKAEKIEKAEAVESASCPHCKKNFGTARFQDGTRLRCDCGYMVVIKLDGSRPSAYEILGVKTNDSLAACRNAWNRIQKKYLFYVNSVANWQARQAFYEIKKKSSQRPLLFEAPSADRCLICEPLKKLELSCCIACGRKIQEELSKEQRDKLRKQLRSKLVELSDWDDLLVELQDYVQAEELILKEDYPGAETILVRLREELSSKTTTLGNAFELLQYVTLALFRSRRSVEQFSSKDVEALHRILMIQPNQQTILLLVAILAMTELEFVEANHYLDYLLQLGNQDAQLLAALARLLAREYGSALLPLEGKTDLDAQFLRGRTLVALRRYEEAQKIYETLLAQQHPILNYHYACFLANDGKREEALALFQKCEIELPNDPRPVLMVGHLLALAKQYAEAETQYEKASKLGAEVESAVSRGKLAYCQNDLKASLSFMEQALAKAPNHFEAILGIGKIYELQENLSQASHYYSEAITNHLDPEGTGLVNIGLLSLKQNEKDKARRYLAEAFKLGNRSPAALAALGMCYVELKDHLSARMVWEELNQVCPNTEVTKNLAHLNYLIAKFEIRKGQHYKAIKCLQQYMKYNQSKEGLEKILSEVFFRLGTQEIFYQFQDGQRPRKFFNFAAQYQPKNPYIQYYLGHVLLQMEEPKKALSCFQKAYELKPKPQFIRQVCLTRILLKDSNAKKLLLELPLDPQSPEQTLVTVWFECCFYLTFKEWEKALHLLHYLLTQRETFRLTRKESLKLRILMIRVLYLIDEKNETDQLIERLDQFFQGSEADLMQGLYLLLCQELEEAHEHFQNLYEKEKDGEILEAYRYLFAILITKSKLTGEDPEDVLATAKAELLEDPEVFNWELAPEKEEEELPTYSLLLDSFQANQDLNFNFKEDTELKPLEEPYPLLLSKEGIVLLKETRLKIGTETHCDILLAGKDPFFYELVYYKEAGKFVLSTPKDTVQDFWIQERPYRRMHLNHRDQITLYGHKFSFLEQRDPTQVYGDVAYGLKMVEDWSLLFTDLRNASPEEDFTPLQFSNVSISRLSSLKREDNSILEFHFE